MQSKMCTTKCAPDNNKPKFFGRGKILENKNSEKMKDFHCTEWDKNVYKPKLQESYFIIFTNLSNILIKYKYLLV